MNGNQKARTHLFANIGSRTERGGRIAAAGSGLLIEEHNIAIVGDEVVSGDGAKATLIDGAGCGATWEKNRLSSLAHA